MFNRHTITRELSLCDKLKCSNPYIFTTWWFDISNLNYLIEHKRDRQQRYTNKQRQQTNTIKIKRQEQTNKDNKLIQ